MESFLSFVSFLWYQGEQLEIADCCLVHFLCRLIKLFSLSQLSESLAASLVGWLTD